METREALVIAKPALTKAIQDAQQQVTGLQLLARAVDELAKENDFLQQELRKHTAPPERPHRENKKPGSTEPLPMAADPK